VTSVAVQQAAPRLIEIGIAAAPLAGQTESGDLPVVVPFPEGVLVAALDGLGHGPEAALAARLAGAELIVSPYEPLESLVSRCHEAARGSRGLVMSVAFFSAPAQIMSWLSVGNVAGVLFRASTGAVPARESVVLRGGVVGSHLPMLRPRVVPVEPGDTLVFATDGIAPNFTSADGLSRPPQETADRIFGEFALGTDDALVLVARYVGPP
jgi:hypothetical protein